MQSLRTSRLRDQASARPAPRSRQTYDDSRETGLPSSIRPPPGERGEYRRGMYDDRVYAEPDAMSTSSVSSSGSSLMDRMRPESTRTSVDSDDYSAKYSQGAEEHAANNVPQNEQQEGGSWFWNKMSNLTVSVSKALVTDAETQDGEATPPGEDSRLTRTLKAYHLQKASNPSELPDWLFSEQERFPGRSRPPVERERYQQPVEEPAPQPSQRSYSLRENHESAPASDPRARPVRSITIDEDSPAPSRATNRLKAMREAKRQATLGPSAREGGYQDNRWLAEEQVSAREGAPEPRAQRGGLPSGPGRSNRF